MPVTTEYIRAAITVAAGTPPITVTPSRNNEAILESSFATWIISFPESHNHLPCVLYFYGCKTNTHILPQQLTIIQCSRCRQWHNTRVCASSQRCRLCGFHRSNLNRFGKNGSNNDNQKNLDKNSNSRPRQITANSLIPTRDKFAQAVKENLCWTCGKPGHKSYECRKKPINPETLSHENRINIFYLKMFPDAEPSSTGSIVIEASDDQLSGYYCP